MTTTTEDHDTRTTMESKMARVFGLEGEQWMRHANPFSVWSRFSCDAPISSRALPDHRRSAVVPNRAPPLLARCAPHIVAVRLLTYEMSIDTVHRGVGSLGGVTGSTWEAV